MLTLSLQTTSLVGISVDTENSPLFCETYDCHLFLIYLFLLQFHYPTVLIKLFNVISTFSFTPKMND